MPCATGTWPVSGRMIWVLLVSAAIWVGLLAFWGGFWRADQRFAADLPVLEAWPEVVALIPARNEAETIGAVLRAHMSSDYPGALSVVLVDDNSTDGTGDIARTVAQEHAGGRALHVVTAPPLQPGWTGKLWALHQGQQAVDQVAPDAQMLLLTDADIVHAPSTLRRLVARAEEEGQAMVSLMARLDARGLWGRLLIPAFVFFFQKLYPFPMVNNPASRMAAAAGGCVLVRRQAMDEIGGVAALRGALIDDCTLGQRLKDGPPRRSIWLGLAGDEVVSLRDNRALGSVWTMVARTAFTQLHHSMALLAGCVLGMALIYLAGPGAVLTWPVHGRADLLAVGLGAWGLMGWAYRPTARLYGQPWWWGLTLPLAALLYTAMTVDSARAHLMGRGGAWKGRTYPVEGA